MRQKAENRRFPCEGEWFVAGLDDLLTFTTSNGKTYAYEGEGVPDTLEGMTVPELCEMLRRTVGRARGQFRRGSR